MHHDHPNDYTLHPNINGDILVPWNGIIFGGDIVIIRGKGGKDNQCTNTNGHNHAKDNLTQKKLGRKKRRFRTAGYELVIYNQTKML